MSKSPPRQPDCRLTILVGPPRCYGHPNGDPCPLDVKGPPHAGPEYDFTCESGYGWTLPKDWVREAVIRCIFWAVGLLLGYLYWSGPLR